MRILNASIDVHELTPITAAIKTLSEEDIIWESVTERLIEERPGLTIVQNEYLNTAPNECTYYNLPDHHAVDF